MFDGVVARPVRVLRAESAQRGLGPCRLPTGAPGFGLADAQVAESEARFTARLHLRPSDIDSGQGCLVEVEIGYQQVMIGCSEPVERRGFHLIVRGVAQVEETAHI